MFEVRSRKFEVDFTLRNSNFTLLSGCHYTGRSVPARSNPALVIANKNNAGELSLPMLLVGRYQGKRTICSTTTVLRQPLGNAQDRIVWIDLGIMGRRIGKHWRHPQSDLAETLFGWLQRQARRYCVSGELSMAREAIYRLESQERPNANWSTLGGKQVFL